MCFYDNIIFYIFIHKIHNIFINQYFLKKVCFYFYVLKYFNIKEL